jgi:hypothetical protein
MALGTPTHPLPHSGGHDVPHNDLPSPGSGHPGHYPSQTQMQHETAARMDRPQGSPPDGAVSTRQPKIHHPHLSNALVLNYAQMFREAGSLTRIEPQNEFTPHRRISETSRGDLQVYNFRGGQACFGVSVTHPALLHQGSNTVPEAGKAANLQPGTAKVQQIQGNCEGSRKDFLPSRARSARASWRRSSRSSQGLRAEDCCTQEATGGECVIHYWRSKLSLALQISQARAVHERFRGSLLAHNVGSDESSRLNYRGIAWAR